MNAHNHHTYPELTLEEFDHLDCTGHQGIRWWNFWHYGYYGITEVPVDKPDAWAWRDSEAA